MVFIYIYIYFFFLFLFHSLAMSNITFGPLYTVSIAMLSISLRYVLTWWSLSCWYCDRVLIESRSTSVPEGIVHGRCCCCHGYSGGRLMCVCRELLPILKNKKSWSHRLGSPIQLFSYSVS